MKISFFEEFPTKENLTKLTLLSWPTKLYIASSSLYEFETIAKSLKTNKNLKKVIYWPILTKKEGYWISPFSQHQALTRIFNELKNKKVPVMLDLELPTTRNSLLYATQFFNFIKNKKLISQFIQDYSGEISLCEYLPNSKKSTAILSWLGLHYETNTSKVKVRNIIKMMYHSMIPYTPDFIHREMERGVKMWGNQFTVGFGTIATGVLGTEPILDPKTLENDLILASAAGVHEVVMFRLGGLNKEYASILRKFSQK